MSIPQRNIRLATLVISIIIVTSLNAQITIQGHVKQKGSNQPVSYVNIGIPRTNIGTLSNPDGSFSILIPSKYEKDTLFFSALGFNGIKFPVKNLSSNKSHTVLLKERVIALKPVTVNANKIQNQSFVLGNPSFRGGTYEPDTTYAGGAVALLIDNGSLKRKDKFNYPVFLQRAKLRIFRNNLESFKFRLRLNAIDTVTGGPGKDLLEQSIVAESSMRNGWLLFDLSKFQFKISGPFFLTFEQILDANDRAVIATGYREFIRKYPERLVTDTVEFEGEKVVRQMLRRGGIDLPGTFIGMNPSESARTRFSCFERKTSLGEWEKVRGIVTATVTVTTQPTENFRAQDLESCDDATPQCKAEALCNDFLNGTGTNGFQIAVSKSNKIVWSKAFGFSDVENQLATTDSTLFRINSISKSMTAVGMMKMISAGKIHLDASIRDYLPELPAHFQNVTARHLASHRAGLRDYHENDPDDFIRTQHYNTCKEAMTVFMHDTLLFKPGSDYQYSPFGYVLIGAMIESVTGKNFLNFMHDEVWAPMSMLDTQGDDVLNTLLHRSRFYDVMGEESTLGDFSYKYPSGGILSTANDLVTFGSRLLAGDFLEPSIKQLMFTPQGSPKDVKVGYGFGWYIGQDKNGHRMFYHSGDTFSSSSQLILYPDLGLVIAFVANSQEGAAFDLVSVAEHFYTAKQ